MIFHFKTISKDTVKSFIKKENREKHLTTENTEADLGLECWSNELGVAGYELRVFIF